ncbi:hypothetical protein GQ53DRAFT_91895 [Thozetella sp. PMI_491]|nr:hypothetical protein GQ53DRAFT_91895 [Thozetella sp. PMI_491]
MSASCSTATETPRHGRQSLRGRMAGSQTTSDPTIGRPPAHGRYVQRDLALLCSAETSPPKYALDLQLAYYTKRPDVLPCLTYLTSSHRCRATCNVQCAAVSTVEMSGANRKRSNSQLPTPGRPCSLWGRGRGGSAGPRRPDGAARVLTANLSALS